MTAHKMMMDICQHPSY